jgi:hypothetical protein
VQPVVFSSPFPITYVEGLRQCARLLLRDSGPTRYFQGVHKKMAKTKKLAKVKKLEKTVTLKYGRDVLLSS